MPSNKDRLYIALYARGGAPTMPGKEDTYHWALLVGPKDDVENGMGMCYHAKETITGPGASAWAFQERPNTLSATSMLLVRVMIAKVEKKDRFLSIVRERKLVRQGVAGWSSVGWVQEVLQILQADGKALGTSVAEWTEVRDTAMNFCQKKKDKHRYIGQGNYDMTKVPTYDLLEKKETIP